MLQTHGWQAPSQYKSDCAITAPISPGTCETLQLELGPIEGTKEYATLATDMNFNCRQNLGKLMYTYVIACCDIGYAVTFLAQYSQSPSKGHDLALKNVAKYLRATRDYGIYYW